MESSTILTADVLDILFEGRNKEYGAYELRRTYKKRLVTSITVMLSVLLLCCIGFAFANDKKKQPIVDVIPDDVMLKNIEQEQPVEPPPPPPPPKMQEPPRVEILKFTPPVIVNDDQVKKEDMPPETDKLVDTKIGNFNQDGLKDDGLVAPPVETGIGKGIIEKPVKDEEDYNKVFTKVEIESEFPGGLPAWQRFLNRNLRPSDEAQGTVVVQFIVDKEGNVTNVEAVSGPDELRSEAVRVIKKSGKWTPAIQNGNPVRSYKKQPIIFRVDEG
jgi:periplasmic protein TonB